MLSAEKFLLTLQSEGVNFFAGVPDSLLKEFCQHISVPSKEFSHIIAINEGSAIALGIGNFLATGSIPLIYMQNSGIGNAVNPLISLASKDVYQIPLILLIGWRGEQGTADEPQHITQGRIMEPLLEGLEIPHVILSKQFDTAKRQVAKVITRAKMSSSPQAILVQKIRLKN